MNENICSFVDADIYLDIVMDMEQQMTLKLFHRILGKELIVILVYTKCDAMKRIELWDSMYHLASNMDSPWLVGGDFSVILFQEEKYGGLPIYLSEVEDCVDTCALYDLGFKRSLYTWWNGKSDVDCIFNRLPRYLANQQFQDLFSALEVEHLIKYVSDHVVLLLSCNVDIVQVKKPFKFLNFWTKHDTFLKNRAKLHEVETDLTKYYHLVEEFWRQKAGIQWFKDGDRNSKFFHAHVRGKRKKLHVSRILDNNDNWIESQEDIAKEVVEFIQAQSLNKGHQQPLT
ncbi:uncharacterized protein LOC142168930 [Nicotiana tabacum]|uniref:Uncharacterized protein LOC142168930 n=1 Tax=Nicotiana tabacum TaxID=4097 RepID=A0AC58SMM4_TOBAC